MPNPKSSRPTRVRQAALKERGWDRDLRDLYLKRSNHGWYLFEEIERVEQTAEWQRDAARVAMELPLLLSTSDLRNRDWTTTMIKSLLGEPDAIITLTPSGSRVMHKYRAARVEEVEAGAGFQERVAAGRRRSSTGKKAAAARADQVMRAVEIRSQELAITKTVPDLATLRDLALQHQQSRYAERGDFSRDTDDADDETVDRWCRNYLRHVCSNYDSLLVAVTREFKGVPGVRDIYEDIVRPKVDELVEAEIDFLKRPAASDTQ